MVGDPVSSVWCVGAAGQHPHARDDTQLAGSGRGTERTYQVATSKNNPDARRIEGWRCSRCNTVNPLHTTVCRGRASARVLVPNPSGRGMRETMEHTVCGAVRAS